MTEIGRITSEMVTSKIQGPRLSSAYYTIGKSNSLEVAWLTKENADPTS